jgi:SAM-dependent methyltransferase
MNSSSQQMVTQSLEFLSSVYNYNHWMARTLEPFIGENILELGCGIGNILQYYLLRQKLTGVDLDQNMINYCQKKFDKHENCEFICADIFEDEIKLDANIDTMISMNVIEHIEDDRAALKWMVDNLALNGTLVTLVPAHPHIHGSIDEAAGHHRRYVMEDLITKIEGIGCHVTNSFYFNCIGYFGWGLNSRVFKKKNIPVKQTLIYDRYVVPLQAWAEGIIKPPFGQSLVVIARKREDLSTIDIE